MGCGNKSDPPIISTDVRVSINGKGLGNSNNGGIDPKTVSPYLSFPFGFLKKVLKVGPLNLSNPMVEKPTIIFNDQILIHLT